MSAVDKTEIVNPENDEGMGNQDISNASKDREEEAEGSTENEETSSDSKGKISSSGLPGSLFTHKGMLVSVFVLIMTFLVLGMYFGFKWIGHKKPITASNTQEKPRPAARLAVDLPTFFVPFPAGASKVLAKIDLTIMYDRLASVRFKDQEIEIRDRLYVQLVDLVNKEGVKLKLKSLFVETEMNKSLMELLGSNDLEIRLKKIEFI